MAQSQTLFIGRLLDASQTPPSALPANIKVALLVTGQETLTDSNGVFQFILPKHLVPGSEIQFETKAGNLRIYLPPGGVTRVPSDPGRPEEIQLLPAGSKPLLSGRGELILSEATKPPPQVTLADPNKKIDHRPLSRFLKDWSAYYGFSYEQAHKEVQAWGDQIRANREKSTPRQQGLAEFEAKNFGKSAELFRESALAVGTELDSLGTEYKALEDKRRTRLREFLDDEIRAAESLGNQSKFLEAADELAASSKRVARDRYPGWWAEMQSRLATALVYAGRSGGGSQSILSLRDAVSGYQNALEIFTKGSLPREWAAAQGNLGSTYAALGERESGEEAIRSLVASVRAFENALTVQTRDTLPQEWATTQSNLGVTYVDLGERQNGEEGMKSLRAAVVMFKDALTVRTKSSSPQEWAATQVNLGVTYVDLGKRQSGEDGMKSLRAAVASFEDALTVNTRNSLPQAWATTQLSLGNTSIELGKRQNGEEGMRSLRAAVGAFEDALTVNTRNSLPQEWASTQINLGNAYDELGKRQNGEEGMKSFRAAVNAFEHALTVVTKDTLPQGWANTEMNLGIAYVCLGERQDGDGGIKSLQAAVSAFERALTVHTKDALPQSWATTQMNLGTVYVRLGERQGGEDGLKCFRAAVEAFEKSLAARAKHSLPQDWALTEMNLGMAYARLGERQEGEEGMKDLRVAVGALENALTIQTKSALPQDWAMTQMNLGAVYRDLGERKSGEEKMKSLREAVDAFENALTVYTKDALPQAWATTELDLALALGALEKWPEAAKATEAALSSDTNLSEALTAGSFIYHEKLFQYDRAFELNARLVALGKGRDDFVEKHLTTARFADCASKASDRLAEKLEPAVRLALTAIRLACQSAAMGHIDARTSATASEMLLQIHNVQKTDWSFSGTKHFVAQCPAFAAHSTEWVHFFEALEEGDEAKARAALLVLGFHD